MANRFSVEAVFKAVDRVTAPVKRMQNRVGKFTRSMSNRFNKLNRSVNKFASGMKRAGIAATGALLISGTAMANVVSTGAEFEQTLVNAAAKFPGEIRKGSEAFKTLEDTARKAGATTEFTASQAAEGLNFLAMAGFDANQSVAALPGLIDLATAAQTDLATASDIATDSLGAFGLATKDTEQLQKNLARVSDVMARTTTSANVNMEQLFETIVKGGATATAAGMELEEFAAMTGLMANSGLKASEAGSVMKNMVLKLSAPTAGAQKLLRRFNITTKDSKGNLLGLTDILGQMERNLSKLGTAQKGAVLDTIFGKRAIVGVQLLMDSGAQSISDYTKQLQGASGASKEMATTMRDTVQGRLRTLNSAIESVKISIFSTTEGPLADVIDKMTLWVRTNEKLIATNVGGWLANVFNNADKIVDSVKSFASWAKWIFILVVALKSLAAIIGIVNGLMLMNPIGLMVVAVAALAAGITYLVNKFDLLSKAADALNNVPVLSDIGRWLGGAAADLFGDGATGPQVVTPQERTARSIEENTTVNRSEVTIKPEAGTAAEQTGGTAGPGLTVAPSGAFN